MQVLNLKGGGEKDGNNNREILEEEGGGELARAVKLSCRWRRLRAGPAARQEVGRWGPSEGAGTAT